MELILQVIFSSVFSGFVLSMAIPNEIYLFGFPFYTLLAFIPLYLIFNKIKDFRTAFLAFFIQTLTTHLISSFWLAYFKDFAIFTLGASALGTACIGGAFGLYLYLPYYTSSCKNKLNYNSAVRALFKSPSFRIIYFSAIYTLYEWAKSSGFLGYPWGTVSSAMFKWPLLMQTASITGTYGITFIIVMANAIIAELFQFYYSDNRHNESQTNGSLFYIFNCGKVFLILFGLMLIHGFWQYDKNLKPVKYLNTIIVQQNSDPWKTDTDRDSILLSEELTKQKIDEVKNSGKEVNLVVWSEGCLQKTFPNSESIYKWYPVERPLTEFVKDCNVPFIFGGSSIRILSNDRKQIFNAALLFDENGKYRGYYGKNHLVPFAECIPFIEVPFVHTIIENLVGISAGWTPGDQYVFFNVPCRVTDNFKLPAVKDINLNQTYFDQFVQSEKPYTVKISTPICFDDAFTDIMRPLFLNGTELFVNITDDSWSLKKSSEIQHFVIASYRAIEYRTTLVRSANAGYSVVVNPSGKVVADLPLFKEAALAYDIPVYERKMTTYARFGNWLPYLCLIFFAASSIYAYITFCPYDYIPSERKQKKSKKDKKSKKSDKKGKKNSKNKK